MHPVADPGALHIPQPRERHPGTADDRQGAEGRPPGMRRIDDQGQRHDARRVRDRDLGQQLEGRFAVEVQRIEDRQDQCRRRGGHQDGVQGGVPGVEQRGDAHRQRHREDSDADGTGRPHPQCASQPAIPHRDVGPGDEHDHCESDVREEREGGVAGVQQIEHGRPHDGPGGKLSEDHRQVPPSGQSEHRTEQCRYRDHRKRHEVHRVPPSRCAIATTLPSFVPDDRCSTANARAAPIRTRRGVGHNSVVSTGTRVAIVLRCHAGHGRA